jgi:hypothetical protein
VTGEGDKTQVDTDELDRFADGLEDRADRTATAADTIRGGGSIPIRFEQLSESFGLLGSIFGADAIRNAHQTADGVHTLADNLSSDARLTRESSAEFTNTNEGNADRFRSRPHE